MHFETFRGISYVRLYVLLSMPCDISHSHSMPSDVLHSHSMPCDISHSHSMPSDISMREGLCLTYQCRLTYRTPILAMPCHRWHTLCRSALSQCSVAVLCCSALLQCSVAVLCCSSLLQCYLTRGTPPVSPLSSSPPLQSLL